MSEPVGLFVLGLLVLATGAGALVVGACRLAARRGGGFAVALVAVGVGPSVAPLAFGLALAPRDGGQLAALLVQVVALGTLIGSGVAGVLLVLGAAAVVRPIIVSARLFGTAIPVAIGSTLLFWFLARDEALSRTDGGILLAAFAAALVLIARAARREPARGRAAFADVVPLRLPTWAAVTLTVVGLIAVVGGAELAAARTLDAGRALKLSAPALGLTLATFGTMLPALVGAVVASRNGRSDVALGLAVGPLVCVLLAVGIVALVQPLPVPEVLVMNDVPAVALCALLLLIPFANGSVPRWEGALLLAAAGGFVAWQLARVVPGR